MFPPQVLCVTMSMTQCAVQSQPGKLLIDTGRTRNRAGDEGSKTEQGIGSAGADTKQVKPEQSRSGELMSSVEMVHRVR